MNTGNPRASRWPRGVTALVLVAAVVPAYFVAALGASALGSPSATSRQLAGPAGVVTVDAGCNPGSSDCAREINRTIAANKERPLIVTFGEDAQPGTRFTFGSTVRLSGSVSLVGLNEPIAAAATSHLFRLDGAQDVVVSDFAVDLQRCRGVRSVFFASDGSQFNDVEIRGLDVENGPSATCNFFTSRASGATGLTIENVRADRVHRFVWFPTGSDHRDIRLSSNHVTDLGNSAFVVDGYAEDILIENNSFLRHGPNTKTGHMIGFQPSKKVSPSVSARNVVIRGNRIEGRPGLSHIMRNGVNQATGGSADLVALRGIDGFILEDNVIMHSGEVGVTATAGLRNGVIRNNVVAFTDTAGIVLGNEAAGNAGVANIDVYGNELFSNGLDRANELRPKGWVMPTISVWNATNLCVAGNDIHDNDIALGLWVFDGDSDRWPASVFGLHVADNSFANNRFDFVQSSHPVGRSARGGYQTATPEGGENWTARPGAEDADRDGLAEDCHSESNDGDSCVPFARAAACAGPEGAVPALPTVIENPALPTVIENPTEPTVIENPTEPTVIENPTEPTVIENVDDDVASVVPSPEVPQAVLPEPPPTVAEVIDQPAAAVPAKQDQPACGSATIECGSGSTITIRARGTTGQERMKLAINGRYAATFPAVSSSFSSYTFEVDRDVSLYELRVNFTNKGNVQGLDRMLQIDFVEIDGERIQAEDADTIAGSVTAADPRTCLPNGAHGTDTLRCNGAIRFFFHDQRIDLDAPSPLE